MNPWIQLTSTNLPGNPWTSRTSAINPAQPPLLNLGLLSIPLTTWVWVKKGCASQPVYSGMFLSGHLGETRHLHDFCVK